MQYLLTEEEMQAIRDERSAVLMNLPGRNIADHIVGLTNVCRHVATKMTETGENLPNGRKPSEHPHGCIHVNRGYGLGQAVYCDRCPVAGICPQPKEWSK